MLFTFLCACLHSGYKNVQAAETVPFLEALALLHRPRYPPGRPGSLGQRGAGDREQLLHRTQHVAHMHGTRDFTVDTAEGESM